MGLEHHLVWLRSHPHRSHKWLKERLSDGFDVHHIDGDHSNNNPDNLVLIEHVDHMRLHGMSNSIGRIRSSMSGPRKSTLERGQAAYQMIVKIVEEDPLLNSPWQAVELALSIKRSVARSSARTYALHNDLPWPVVFTGRVAQKKAEARSSDKDYRENTRRSVCKKSLYYLARQKFSRPSAGQRIWADVAEHFEIGRSDAFSMTKAYAIKNGLDWPLRRSGNQG